MGMRPTHHTVSFLRWALLVGASVLLAEVTLYAAPPPKLDSIAPSGAKRGEKVTLQLRGTFGPGAAVLAEIPGVLTIDPKVDPAKPTQSLACTLVLKQDAPVGLYPIRVQTPDGISGYRLFSVGSLPETTEVEPNESPDTPQAVTLPQTINGSLRGTDQDVFSVHLRPGERLVAEVEARRLGSKADPVLHLTDKSGRELAVNDDVLGFEGDCRIDFTATEEGDYFLTLHDAIYRNAGPYRLKVGSYDYATSLFPSGGTRAPSQRLEMEGGTLQNPLAVSIDASTKSLPWTMIPQPTPGSAALPLRFRLSDQSEITEADLPPEGLQAGQVLHGRLQKPGEVDTFPLAVNPGEQWRVKLEAAGQEVAMDPLLRVYDDNNKQLALNDDAAGLNAALTFAVPADIKRVKVSVQNRLPQQEGEPASYRLLAEKPRSDFRIELLDNPIALPQGEPTMVRVKVDRGQFSGPIQLTIPEELKGITAEGGLISPGQSEGFLLLTAAKDLKSGLVPLEIWGQGGAAAKPIRRKAQLSEGLYNPWVEASAMDKLLTAVIPASGWTIDIPARELTLLYGHAVKIPIQVTRPEGNKGEVKVEVRSNPLNFQADRLKTSIAGDKTSGQVSALHKRMDMKDADVLLVLTATFDDQGTPRTIVLPPVSLAVRAPFVMDLLSPTVSSDSTSTASLDVLVDRKAGFGQPVQLTIEGLPTGGKATAVEVPNGSRLGRLSLQLENVKPGKYQPELVASGATPQSGTYQAKRKFDLVVTAPKKEDAKEKKSEAKK